MNDFRAEVREFHRFVVGQLIDDACLGHAIRIGAHDAVDICPDTEFAGAAERRKDCCRIIAAVTAEGRLQAGLVRRDKAGHDGDARKIRGHDVAEFLPGFFPEHRGAEFGLVDRDDLSRVDPGPAALGRKLSEQRCEQACRPDFAVARHDVAAALRRRSNQRNRLQYVADVLCVLAPGIEHPNESLTIEQRLRRLCIALPDGVEPCFEGVVVALGLAGQVEKRIRHAAHRGYNHADALPGALDHEAGYAVEAVCVREATAPEFMDFPAIVRQLPVRPLRKTLNDSDSF